VNETLAMNENEGEITLPLPAPAHSAAGNSRWQAGELTRTRLLIVLPAALVLALFFYPLLDLFWMSFTGGPYPGSVYVDVAKDHIFLLSLKNALFFALTTAAFAAVLGYPVAIVVGFSKPSVATFLLLVVMVPFWTSVLVRTYAWLVILGREGMINSIWLGLGLGTRPLQLTFNGVGVTIAMVHVMLPYMVLPIVNSISRIDQSTLAAASSLGANRWYTFKRVLFPLTLPGLAGGCALVFVLSIGFFITPALMGGPRDLVTAMVIHDQITKELAWEHAAASSAILLAIMGGLFLVFSRVLGLGRHMAVQTR
jgi:ABC-type spermidine/putrescine transport system permease subunit I